MTTPNAGRGDEPRHDGPRTQGDEPRVVVRDRRRIDPETGEVRAPSADDAADGEPTPEAPAVDHKQAELRAQLDERTADLQRLTAEYANYRKRVERDRVAVLEASTATVLGALVPVLDDLDRAGEHGDLTGPFKAVADQLQGILGKLGLERFGEVGDPFDPSLHEAVMHSLSPDVTEPTCVQVMRPGYRHGERMLRPAMVAVAEPESTPEPAAEPAEPTDVPDEQ